MTANAGAAAVAGGRPRNAPLYLAMVVLLAVSYGVQAARDRGWQPYQPENSLLWVRSGKAMSRLSLGYRNIVADVYWMRAVVYYGGKRLEGGEQPNYDLLYPLLDMVTTVDPHFRVGYRFGAIFLTEGYPAGPGRPDQAMLLLQNGIARDFARWEYFHDIGFIYYWWLNQPTEAAKWFSLAGDRPGAPEWLKPLAAVTLAGGGNRESSRTLWRNLQQSEVEYIRNSAAFRLMQLDAMDLVDQIQPILDRFVAREHRMPDNWEELVAAERLPGMPKDPTGVPLAIDSKTGRLNISRNSELWPPPTEPVPGIKR